ncbi:MAG: glycosyltransferase family 39 protein [Patescibacteria group bacterium]
MMKRFAFGIGILLIILVYSILSFASIEGTRIKLNSPDETANYFSARTLAQTDEIGYAEPLLESSKGVVHPRSMTTAGDRVVPVGFLGLAMFYGTLGKIFGPYLILFFTPVLAVLSAWLLYLFLAYFFPMRVAALSGVLLLVHPAYWYYASRGMLPNVLFVDFLLLGAWLLVAAYRSELLRVYFFSGIAMGLALTVRLSEAIWIIAALFLAAILSLPRRFVAITIVFLIGCALPLAGLFALNASVYGHPFIFGYQNGATYESVAAFDRLMSLVSNFNIEQLPALREELDLMLEKARVYIVPFGYDPASFAKHFELYGISMFWWFTHPAHFGFYMVLPPGLYECFLNKKRELITYIFAFLLISFWLVMYYGSWTFTDNINDEVTIGNSYVRYWLPFYILSIPFVAWVFVSFLRRGTWLVSRTLIVLATVVVMMFFSGKAVLYEYKDSVFPLIENIKQYHASVEWILANTEEDAVIFSQRSDKNFFPERKVAQVFPEFAEKEFLPPLVARAPVYYYGMWNDEDAAYISSRYLSEYDLALEYVADFAAGERLFRVVYSVE